MDSYIVICQPATELAEMRIERYNVINLKDNPTYEFIPGCKYLVLGKDAYNNIASRIHLGPRSEGFYDVTRMTYLLTRSGVIFRFSYLNHSFKDEWLDENLYKKMMENIDSIKKKFKGAKLSNGISKKGRPWYRFSYKTLILGTENEEFLNTDTFLKTPPKLIGYKIIRDSESIKKSFRYFYDLPVGTRFGLDYETDGFPFDNKGFTWMGVSIVTKSGVAAYYDIEWMISQGGNFDLFKRCYKYFLDKHSRECYTYNCSFEMRCTYLMLKKMYLFAEAQTINKIEGNNTRNYSLKFTAMSYLGVSSWDDDFELLQEKASSIFKESTIDTYKESKGWKFITENYPSEIPEFERLITSYWGKKFRCIPSNILGKYCCLDSFHTVLLREKCDELGYSDRCWNVFNSNMKLGALLGINGVYIDEKVQHDMSMKAAWYILYGKLNCVKVLMKLRKMRLGEVEVPEIPEVSKILKAGVNPFDVKPMMKRYYSADSPNGFNESMMMDELGMDLYMSIITIWQKYFSTLNPEKQFRSRKVFDHLKKFLTGRWNYSESNGTTHFTVNGVDYNIEMPLKSLVKLYWYDYKSSQCDHFLNQMDLFDPKEELNSFSGYAIFKKVVIKDEERETDEEDDDESNSKELSEVQDGEPNEESDENIKSEKTSGEDGIQFSTGEPWSIEKIIKWVDSVINLNSADEVDDLVWSYFPKIWDAAVDAKRNPDKIYEHLLDGKHETYPDDDKHEDLWGKGAIFWQYDRAVEAINKCIEIIDTYSGDKEKKEIFLRDLKNAEKSKLVFPCLLNHKGDIKKLDLENNKYVISQAPSPVSPLGVRTIIRDSNYEGSIRYTIKKNFGTDLYRKHENPEVFKYYIDHFNEIDVTEFSLRGLAKFGVCYRMFKKYIKLWGTYITGMLVEGAKRTNGYDENSVTTEKWNHDEGLMKIYPKFNVMEKKSKRWSAGFHTIPSDSEVKRIVTCPPGYFLSYFDISGAEVRAISYLSQDPFMLNNYKLGKDPYIEAAKVITPNQTPEFYKQYRGHYKQTLLGKIYGMGNGALAGRIKKTVAEAEKASKDLFNLIKVVDEYIKVNGEYPYSHDGRIDTVLGDRISIKNESSDRWSRLGINLKIQEFAAITLAQGFDKIIEDSFEYNEVTVRPLNVVHDSSQNYFKVENIFEIASYYKKNLTDYLYDLHGVLYKFDTLIGTNYFDLAELTDLGDGRLKLSANHMTLKPMLDRLDEAKVNYTIESLINDKGEECQTDGRPNEKFVPKDYPNTAMAFMYKFEPIFDIDESSYDMIIKKC